MQINDKNYKSEDLRFVQAKAGTIIGRAANGIKYFLGIPYGEDTGGEKRFQPAQGAPLLENYPAFSYGGICPQGKRNKDRQGEDCLSLNIWAPDDEELYPVLVYIHGGSFMSGSGSLPLYRGDNLVRDQKILMLSFNYRVGALGFLDFSFLDDRAVANPGFSDILLLLAWVKENIVYFGGDPEKITVMGQSAGGTVASLLLCLKDQLDFLAGMVIVSGNPVALYSQSEGRDTARQYLEFLQIKSMKELREIPADKIGQLNQEFRQFIGRGVTTFQPVIDKEQIPDYPLRCIQEGKAANIPVMAGVTGDEASFFRYSRFRESWGLENIIASGKEKEEMDFLIKMNEVYEKEYKKDPELQAYSDIFIRLPLFLFARELAARQDVWLYRFDWYSRLQASLGLKAFHTSDIFYFFGNLIPALRFNLENTATFQLASEKRADQFLAKIVYGSDFEEAEQISYLMRKDLASFADKGQLNWQQAKRDSMLAKCYDQPVSFEPLIPPDIITFWQASKYFQDCLNPPN